MIIIGLTGGIGMGKSTAAKILRRQGVPVHSSDAAVHRALKKGGDAVYPITKLFPKTQKRNGIDRNLLGRAVFNDPAKLRALEKIIHPIVKRDRQKFIREAKKAKKLSVVLEIPLLFETGTENECDFVFCVSAPRAAQKERVLKRKNMSEAKLKAILARQMPDAERRRRADYVVPTGGTTKKTKECLQKILVLIGALPPKAAAKKRGTKSLSPHRGGPDRSTSRKPLAR